MSKQYGRKYIPVDKVFEYWDENSSQLGHIGTDADDWGIYPNECFACGDHGVQRCHIIPRCYGGSDSVDNIHLLCMKCHGESEGRKSYWSWLHWKRKHQWKTVVGHLWDKLDQAGFVFDEKEFRNDEEEYIKNALSLIYIKY